MKLRGAALAVAFSLVSACSGKEAFLPPAGTTGPVIAFDYHPLTKGDISFLSRFTWIVLQGPTDADTVKALKAEGTKLILYEWLPALYYCENSRDVWAAAVFANRQRWALDPADSDPDPMGGRYGCKDLFYDMADGELLQQRVEHVAEVLASRRYDGLFLDWGGGWNDLVDRKYSFVTKEFERRHPGASYDHHVNEFIRLLRERGLTIIVNGGFRSEGAKLNTYADMDIVESMFASESCDSCIASRPSERCELSSSNTVTSKRVLGFNVMSASSWMDCPLKWAGIVTRVVCTIDLRVRTIALEL